MMSISREHYNEIMRIISERHFAAVREKNARQDEVYEAHLEYMTRDFLS